jgi:hypothetical protein
MRLDERYVELGLRIGRHIEGYVDAYFGPARLKERVGREPRREANALVGDAEDLLRAIDDAGLEPQRRRWLRAQVVAMHATSRRLAGEPLGYLEEIELCYGVAPQRTSEDEFAAAHRALDAALPGDGDIRERYAAWLQHALPPDQEVALLGAIGAELRRRVDELVGLPPGEKVDYEVVHGMPWAGFNYYEGGLRSRVALNVDIPLPRSELVHFVAHETYPGHHTERASKEKLFVQERDQLEQTILLVGTPEAVIAEGIAEYGGKHFFHDAHELAHEHLARAGIEYDADVGQRVASARQALSAVGTNVALMIFADGASREEAHAYALEWSLSPEQRVDKMLEFVTHPLWRTYVPSYDAGERLSRAFVDGDPARFKRLLTEQLTPADLTR